MGSECLEHCWPPMCLKWINMFYICKTHECWGHISKKNVLFVFQKPSNVHPFGEVGPHGFSEGIITKPYINQHRSPPRPRENQFHETQPPPFAQQTKLRGVLNVPPPPPPPTSLTSGTENDPQHQRLKTYEYPLATWCISTNLYNVQSLNFQD